MEVLVRDTVYTMAHMGHYKWQTPRNLRRLLLGN